MQTRFSAQQLANRATATAAAAIRKCVHCGFCLATCPTYVLLGDELDSPRGRIYLIKDLLENDRAPTTKEVKHIDRCLSCLACMSTCPSEVHYMHLVDHARGYIEQRFKRPLGQRLLRSVLASVLPHSRRVRWALALARFGRPLRPLIRRIPALQPLAALLSVRAAGGAARAATDAGGPSAVRRGRVLLLQGCVEPVLRPEIRAATVRLLNRAGYEVSFARGEGCCGGLVHHMGKQRDGLAAARRNVDAWTRELERQSLDAIVVTASGCGTVIKNYDFMLREEGAYAGRAARVASLAKDVTELMAEAALPPGNGRGLTVAYLNPCSLQHGQKITDLPERLLCAAGYEVRRPIESHLCCGSAGTYSVLQPLIAAQLGQRKAANLERLQADVIATGNIGCAVQIGERTTVPVVHTVELLDWATGGPAPASLRHLDAKGNPVRQ